MLHVFCLYCMHAPINLSLPDFIRVRLVTDWNRNRSSPFAYRDEVFSRGAFVAVATVLVGPGGLVFMLGMAHMNSIHIHIFFIMFKRNCQDTQGNHHLGYFSKNVSRQVLRVVLRKKTPLTSFDVDLPHEVNPIDVGPFANCQSVTLTSCVLTNSIVSQQKVYEIDVNEVLRNRSHHGDVLETGQKVLTDTAYSFHRHTWFINICWAIMIWHW